MSTGAARERPTGAYMRRIKSLALCNSPASYIAARRLRSLIETVFGETSRPVTCQAVVTREARLTTTNLVWIRRKKRVEYFILCEFNGGEHAKRIRRLRDHCNMINFHLDYDAKWFHAVIRVSNVVAAYPFSTDVAYAMSPCGYYAVVRMPANMGAV